jgi:acyl-CoA hydrolase
MSNLQLPDFLASCLVSNDEALHQMVVSGIRMASSFATSEPVKFYETVWDHIQREDLHDIHIRQALFMAAHPLLVGDTMGATGMLAGLARTNKLARQINGATRKLDGLGRYVAHIEELERRNIHFTSGFMGPAENIVVPDNALTRLLYPRFAGRNRTRMGSIDMQSVHFQDAVVAMLWDADGKVRFDHLVLGMTPPNAAGEMSFGPANGINSDGLDVALATPSVKILLYLNPHFPFVLGLNEWARNTIHVERLRAAAAEGRLLLVEDDAETPAMPAGSFDKPLPCEMNVAEHLVNHMEAHAELVRGRAIQVGIGGTGVQAIRLLKETKWTGREYSEMLDPFTFELFEAGKIAGSHFIDRDGSRRQLDGRLVCTFTMGEKGNPFYEKISNNPAVAMAPAPYIVIPEAFYGGLGINNILSIDFQGSVNSAARGRNHYSGIGGGAAIVRGLSRGGVSYFCMKSTHRTPEGKLRSSIFPYLPSGTPVSVIGPDMFGTRDGAQFFLVTEHGVARINAQSQSDFIKSIISVADPRFRDWLKHEAQKEFRVAA